VGEILTEQQLDRYSAFRRSSLRKGIQVSAARRGLQWSLVAVVVPGLGCPQLPALLPANLNSCRCCAVPSPALQLLVSKTLGGIPNSKAIIALSSVTKSFVDDLVATGEWYSVARERNEALLGCVECVRGQPALGQHLGRHSGTMACAVLCQLASLPASKCAGTVH
jgi:hypothetical protein